MSHSFPQSCTKTIPEFASLPLKFFFYDFELGLEGGDFGQHFAASFQRAGAIEERKDLIKGLNLVSVQKFYLSGEQAEDMLAKRLLHAGRAETSQLQREAVTIRNSEFVRLIRV